MSLEPTTAAAPRRGTRPRNRRALIVAAATDLLYRRGYDQIGMTDLADAVAIGPSALYRHFSGKQSLLREVLAEVTTPARDLMAGLDLAAPGPALRAVATFGLDHRPLGVLWQRDARHLAADDLAALRSDVREIAAVLANAARQARPALGAAAADLIAWSMLAVLTSVSFHRAELPRPAFDDLLAQLLGTVLGTDLPDTPPQPRPAATAALAPRSVREALLTEAARRFARDGYTGVGIEDIGAAVGLAASSVYGHIPSKRDMIVTAFQRGAAVLFMDLKRIHSSAATAGEALSQLVDSYTRFALEHHDIIDLMITEIDHLPEAERHEARQAQHDYVGEWVHLLDQVHPGLDRTVHRIRVHAALTVINNAARTPHLRGELGMPQALGALCARILAP